RMLEQPRREDFQRMLRPSPEHEDPGKAGPRQRVIRADVDRGLVIIDRLTVAATPLGDLAVEVERHTITGLYLQRVAELDARFIQVTHRQVLFAALDMTFEARMWTPATSESQGDREQEARGCPHTGNPRRRLSNSTPLHEIMYS